MGFLKAMKGANNSWGMVTGASLKGIGYIGPENMLDNRKHHLMITVNATTIVFGVEQVERCELICATSEWVKYRILLKDKREFFCTFMALFVRNQKKGREFSMGLLTFEWWLASVIYPRTIVTR